jgi:hypothetical protein
MCDASNNAAPQPACLIFAKQFARRNDILREEVCHFWTVHIRGVMRGRGDCAIAVLVFLRRSGVIASEVKQSIFLRATIDGLLRRFAPLRKHFALVARNDGWGHMLEVRHERLHNTNDAAG